MARCVGDVDRFFAETWGKAPLLQRRREPNGFDDLLTLGDVDFILTTTWLRTPAFRLVKDGKLLNESSYTKWAGVGDRGAYGAVDPGKVYSLFHDGATVVLQAMQRYWLPLARFIRDLEVTMTLPAQVYIGLSVTSHNVAPSATIVPAALEPRASGAQTVTWPSLIWVTPP